MEETTHVLRNSIDDHHDGAALALKKEVEDKKTAESGRDSQERDQKGSPMSKMEISSLEFNSTTSPSAQKGQDDHLLKSTKAEMGEVLEENQRLKMYLDRIMKEYRGLQMQFHEMSQQEPNKSSSTVTTNHQENEEPELVSLSLGRSSSNDWKKEVIDACSNKNHHGKEKIDEEDDKEGLALGLDCKFGLPKDDNNRPQAEHSPNPSGETSSDEAKENAVETTWPPQKGLKTARNEEDEVSQQNPTKRARVSVRVRCDTPTMNDGCQWRKYGQKIAKGNPCPRAYYRCTVAPHCPVRKQVQRCADDMSILITTYEGTHNHPLPISATAMASTTSAAASMLLSGSTTSSVSGPSQPSATASFTTSSLNGLNFYLSDNSKPKPFFLPNSSLSSSPSFPTITLDLTTNPSAASHLNKLGSFPPRYSTTNLNFSSLESNSLPISWSNGVVPNYGTTQPYNKSQPNSLSFGRNPQETLYQNYLQKHILSSTQQNLPSETIAAATKAITSDPSFPSVLAAALTSLIGSGNIPSVGGVGALTSPTVTDKTALSMKPVESFPVPSTIQSIPNVNKCSSSFLNSKPPSSTNSQPGNLMFLPFPTPNTKATSPGDKRSHMG